MTKSKKTAKIKSRKETNKQKKEIKTKERKIMENQNSSFQYWMPVRILFTEAEPDIREEIAGESIVIVTDPFLYESGVAGRTGDRLGNADVSYFSKVEPNPSTDTVNACAAMIRSNF